MEITIKVIIEDVPEGASYRVYKKQKFFFGLITQWVFSHGFKPLDSCFFLMDQDTARLKKVYGDQVSVENKSVLYTPK